LAIDPLFSGQPKLLLSKPDLIGFFRGLEFTQLLRYRAFSVQQVTDTIEIRHSKHGEPEDDQ
jgi:hypothetical protein